MEADTTTFRNKSGFHQLYLRILSSIGLRKIQCPEARLCHIERRSILLCEFPLGLRILYRAISQRAELRFESEYQAKLQALRDMEAFQEFQQSKIGLVLSGSGAKGAYQAGCLKALSDAGFTNIAFISGVSSGALNACAYSLGQVEELQELWQNIGLTRVIKFSPTLPIYLALKGLSILLRLWGGLLPGFLFRLIASAALVYWLVQDFDWVSALALLVLAVTYLPIVAKSIRILGLHLSNFTAKHFSLSVQDNLKAQIAQVTMANTKTGEGGSYVRPTFVTVAEKSLWFDPDNPSFFPFPGAGDQDRVKSLHYNILRPVECYGWLPKYFDISKEPNVEEILLQSAALPAIFVENPIGDGNYADGGIVENSPFNCVLELDCDFTIAIHPSGRSSDELDRLAQVPRLRRALYLESQSLRSLHRKYLRWFFEIGVYEARVLHPKWHSDHPSKAWFHSWDLPTPEGLEIVPLEDVHIKRPIYHLFPKKYLGGLLRGTLNFRRSKARESRRDGMSEMLECLCNILSHPEVAFENTKVTPTGKIVHRNVRTQRMNFG